MSFATGAQACSASCRRGIAARKEVNTADPSQSRIVQKPQWHLNHSGGSVLSPDQVNLFQNWATMEAGAQANGQSCSALTPEALRSVSNSPTVPPPTPIDPVPSEVYSSR